MQVVKCIADTTGYSVLNLVESKFSDKYRPPGGVLNLVESLECVSWISL